MTGQEQPRRPVSREDATDTALLACTRLAMIGEDTRKLADQATPDVLGHEGLADKLQDVLHRMGDVITARAADLEARTRALIEAQDRHHGGGDT